jgi:hypothetical protein
MELPRSRHHLLSCNTGSAVGVNSASSINDRVKVLKTCDMFELGQLALAFPLGRMQDESSRGWYKITLGPSEGCMFRRVGRAWTWHFKVMRVPLFCIYVEFWSRG